MNKPIDVQIANFLRRCFAYYIRQRIKPIDLEAKKDEEWLSNFKIDQDFFEHKLDQNIKILLYKDSILSKSIYFSFEEVEISFLKRYLSKNDVFFDIGANIGLYSLYASTIIRDNGRIYAFEPTPNTFIRLSANLELNSVANVILENKGLSNANEFLKFHVATNGYDAWNSFANLSELKNSDIINIEVITLDNFINANHIKKIDLIKLDVEGWELNVLKGAAKLLSSPDSPVLLVEFTETNAFAAGYYCGELFDYVKSFGYEWYSYDNKTNELILQYKKLNYPYENLIAIKNFVECKNRLIS